MKLYRGTAARVAMPIFWCAIFAALAGGDEPRSSTPASAVSATATESGTDRIFAGEVPKSLADLKAMEERLRTLADRLIAATVGVRIGPVRGSGVVVSADGLVLTAAHVAQRPNLECELVFADGRVVKGKTLGLNRNVDAGMIRLLAEGAWPHVEVASEAVRVGQWCLATGHPGGYETGRKPIVRFGRILESGDSVLISDCTLVGGDSGGPLFDTEGRVIGVHSRIGNMLAANLHVPARAYQRSWDRLVQSEAWGHLPGQAPFLGVRGDPEANRALIAEVFDGMPAAKAGLRVGDVVTSFAGRPVTDFASLTKLVQERNPEERVPLEIRRGEQRIVIEVVLGRR